MTDKFEDLDKMVKKAKFIAFQFHGGQKYGDLPYIDHLQAVVDALPNDDFHLDRNYSYGQAVAWLHDILEDTICSFDELKIAFPIEVVLAVQFLTDPPAPNRKIKKAMFYAGLKEADKSKNTTILLALNLARIVKITDRYCNTKHSIDTNNTKKINMYVKEYGAFSSNFDFYNTTAYQKLEKLMDEVKAVEA